MANLSSRKRRKRQFKSAALRAAIVAFVPILAISGSAHAVDVELKLIVSGLTAPIDFKQPADQSGRRLVLEQRGVIRVLTVGGDLLSEPFLDLRDRMIELDESYETRGLLGFAIHPRFAENGRIYVSYTAPLRDGAPRGWNHSRVLSEFTVAVGTPDRVDPASERILIELDWPSRFSNGGGLAFGPDGRLYVGLGDGAGVRVPEREPYSALDVQRARMRWNRLAQDVTSLFGSILRIDVDAGFPGYAVPADNPFVGRDGRDEIYAWGFRSPYRIAFDRAGRGDMLVTASGGTTIWEAIYLVDRPGNYGWPLKAGARCVDPRRPGKPAPSCPQKGPNGYPIENPIVEYPNTLAEHPEALSDLRSVGSAVVGGQIYRGRAIPDLEGKLVFGDWSASYDRASGQLFVATPPNRWRALWQYEKIAEIDTYIVSIAQDRDGEIYVLANDQDGPYGAGGRIFKLVPATR